MRKISIVYIIIIIFLFSSLLYIGLNKNKQTNNYNVLEQNIVESMKMYYGQDVNLTKLPKDKEKAKVTIDEIRSFGIELNTIVDGDKCTGYGIVTGNGVSHDYKAYIKCSKYTTKNYE